MNFIDQDARLAVVRKRLREAPLEPVEGVPRLCRVVVRADRLADGSGEFFGGRFDVIVAREIGVARQDRLPRRLV